MFSSDKKPGPRHDKPPSRPVAAPASRFSRSDHAMRWPSAARARDESSDALLRHLSPFYSRTSSAPGSYEATNLHRSAGGFKRQPPFSHSISDLCPTPEAPPATKRKRADDTSDRATPKRLKSTYQTDSSCLDPKTKQIQGAGEGCLKRSRETQGAVLQKEVSRSIQVPSANRSRERAPQRAGQSEPSPPDKKSFGKELTRASTATTSDAPSKLAAKHGSHIYRPSSKTSSVKPRPPSWQQPGHALPPPPNAGKRKTAPPLLVRPPVLQLYTGFSKARRAKTSPFFALPRELRDEVYGYLLASPEPITTLKAWTQRYNRYRGGLDPAILTICRQAATEGARVLYSTNTFQYILRDDGNPVPEGMDKRGAVPVSPETRRPRRKTASSNSNAHKTEDVIYLAKYAHLFRRMRLVVEGNRPGEAHRTAAAAALSALASAGVRLETMSFDLSPRLEPPTQGNVSWWTLVDFFSTGLPLVGVLRRDLCYHRLHFIVRTAAGRRLEMDIDANDLAAAEQAYNASRLPRSKRGRRLDGGGGTKGDDRGATRGKKDAEGSSGDGGNGMLWDPWAGDGVVQEESGDGFRCLRGKIEQACESPDAAIMTGLWREDRSDDNSEEEDYDDNDGDDNNTSRRGNAQSVDASQRRPQELEAAIADGERPSGRRSRFLCINLIGGKLRAHIA